MIVYVALLIVSFLIINFVLIKKHRVSKGKNNEATDSVSTIDPEQDEKGENVQKEVTMKNLGVLLFVIGGLWLFVSFNMETTVTTGWGAVNNIGLMDQRRNHLMISGLLIVVGVILFVFGNSKQSDSSPSQLPKPSTRGIQIEDNRKCPYCAELIKAEAIKCKHCGSTLTQAESLQNAKITVPNKELLEQAYARYNKMDINGALDLFKTIILDNPNSPEAEAAKTKIRKILVAKELLEKACNIYYKANDLGFFRVVIEVFPESPQADYAKQQIEKNTGNG